ncbi:PAAR domain-containing protein [Pseudomonas juntendi]|uniref:PAAR domain-containing protein n=1 Tax=Pseudomonas juntendi TaxID=2666183 RepID=UPI003D35A24E
MFEAARLHDEIAHTSALAGFLVGAALGLALIVAVAFATATCGLGVALIAGLLAGVGGMVLTSFGEAAGKMFSTPAGGIETGSPNVFINGFKAAQVEGSEADCKKHPNPRPLVAEGSAKVFYNGQGLRLLQEQQAQLRSLYLYEPDSYAPLARIDSDPEQPERPGKWLPLVPWMERVRERWLACLNI